MTAPGSPISTPNGPGVLQRRVWDLPACWIYVRHDTREMTGREHGRCVQTGDGWEKWEYDEYEEEMG